MLFNQKEIKLLMTISNLRVIGINLYLIIDVYISGGKEYRIKPFLNNTNTNTEDYRYNNMEYS